MIQQRSGLHLLLLIGLLAGNEVLLAHAQVPFPGKCPEVKVMEDFDVEAYLGIWYEYSKYPFAFEIGKKCIYANYSIINNETLSVVNGGINRLTGNPSSISGTAKVLGPARLAVAFFPGQQTTKPNYMVLGTDYESFSVVYSCTNVISLANIKFAWILTREREPTAATIAAAKEILADNKISESFFIDTQQSNCPKLDSNGTDFGAEDLTVGDPIDEFVGTVLPNAIEKA
ncbi:apolipoprotein D isoform X2 [Drosophila guanche]|uniref:Apolipoprotein D n=1 Tax=Drosophila guanche TaxID=7266 RepID=A0A3B0JWS6_DROGU|nr:apolipoprotein D isoform X1 [Drosophila guanche]XP_034125839.1 apolipoprotein D isoform X2 [Drosophila guanche]SPP79950.1 blast:Apolipoprotein D [Drosophila guanche]